jgi:threonine dehydratase
MSSPRVTLDDVRSAAERIRGVAHRTPIVTSRTLDTRAGARVFLKCENFQRVGAFKFRGAYNAISRLSREQLAGGVVTFSSGNHAQAVALACRELASQAVVLMPQDTPASKVAATKSYGAEIVMYDRYSQDRGALGAALAAERGLTLIPPYEHPHVIAGQGTAVLELLEEIGELEAIVVPVGGGGLMAGSATAGTAINPRIKMIGVEPALGNDTQQSLAAGHRVSIPVPATIADGLAADTPGELTYSINERLVDSIVTVTDEEITAAMRFAFDRLKLVIEPSGASGPAAVLSGALPKVKRIGIVLSGGNVDSQRFVDLIGRE